jgi:predicted negative regulator of RcsB-dependent stress response
LFPEDLRTSQYHQYVLLLLQAKDKSYRDISADTLIFATKEYYEKRKEFKNAALASHYSGNVLLEQGLSEKATEMYLKAEELAESTDNNNLKGLIQSNLAFIYYQHFLKTDAIVRGKKAVAYYQKAPNYKKEIHSLQMIGNCLLLENQNDSAFYYYNQALALAETHQLTQEQATVKQSMSIAYRETKNYKYANKTLQDALALSSDSTERARILMNLAQVCLLENQSDSAKYYINLSLAIGVKNAGLIRSTYHFLSQLEEKEGHLDLALQHYKSYTEQAEKVITANKNAALLEIQAKYDFANLKNDNIRLVEKPE